MQIFYKQPEERLDYDIDYSQFFQDDQDGFDSSTTVTATVVPTGNAGDMVTDGIIKIGNPSQKVKVWLKQGVTGTTYEVTVLCTSSSDGRIVEQNFKVKVKKS
jgi:hypothetical protein